ncbi:hypothetical protein P9112_002153 [Eukaryota sp. TZLM1-RC]
MTLSVPKDFQRILRSFTREVLRNQPDNIYDFAAQYFSDKQNYDPSSDYSVSELMDLIRSPAGEETDIFTISKTIASLNLTRIQRYKIYAHLVIDNSSTHTINHNFLSQTLSSIYTLPSSPSPTASSLHGFAEHELQSLLLASLPNPFSFDQLVSFLTNSTFGFTTKEVTFLTALFCNESSPTETAALIFSALGTCYSHNILPTPSHSDIFKTLSNSKEVNSTGCFEDVKRALSSVDLPLSERQINVVMGLLDVEAFSADSYKDIVFEDVLPNLASFVSQVIKCDFVIDDSQNVVFGLDFADLKSFFEKKFCGYSFISRFEFIEAVAQVQLPSQACRCLVAMSNATIEGLDWKMALDEESRKTLLLLESVSQ